MFKNIIVMTTNTKHTGQLNVTCTLTNNTTLMSIQYDKHYIIQAGS